MNDWAFATSYFGLAMVIVGLVLLWIIPEAMQLGRPTRVHDQRHKPRRARI